MQGGVVLDDLCHSFARLIARLPTGLVHLANGLATSRYLISMTIPLMRKSLAMRTINFLKRDGSPDGPGAIRVAETPVPKSVKRHLYYSNETPSMEQIRMRKNVRLVKAACLKLPYDLPIC